MKLFIKGLLLYITIGLTVFLLCSIDSISDNKNMLILLLVDMLNILFCFRLISPREFNKLILNEWLIKHNL